MKVRVLGGGVFGVSAAWNVLEICVSRSMRSTTIITVGFFSAGWSRSLRAAKSIKSDLPEPWKCQRRPFFG